MAANTAPIFPVTPVVGFGKLLTANTLLDGTGSTIELLTAGLNGTRLDLVKIKHLGTNGSNSVVRLFINNGSDSSVATNNTLLIELSVPGSSLTQSLASSETLISRLDVSIPAGYKILASAGTAFTAGVAVMVFGGDY